ncbi:helix-turn-helix domain-containing protein [Pontibacter mangrovi]|uniref:Helix-turn-helix transcriptional regulator n=1 Tax=Pontibacter mangrovi TaxID=2589816 RepID=A0A501W6P4_9BACT|nr:helix-turn-helix domain-containing protein [Pontibacter mangrovi]TPE42487.1 helix-turn-helix transcriptional regulator [Pontibacter mangrovi]
MSTSQVLLILLSSLGVLHGFFLAAFLWVHPKGLSTSNKILSILLLILSFRIGKSVFLEFVDEFYLQLIFAGLAALLLIGPLFHFYTRSVLEKSFRFTTALLLHFIPFLAGIAFSLWTNRENVKTTPVSVFVFLFCLYYGHYLVYLLYSYRQIQKHKDSSEGVAATVQWLQLLFYALAALWVVYVLNLLEDRVPYILGPLLYSFIAYGVSLIAIKKGYINRLDVAKYKTTPLSETEINQIYEHVKELLTEEELYKDPDLALSTFSKALKVSPQKISLAINSRSGSNFNGFVNQYRIKHAQALLEGSKSNELTIAAIAYEVGFNSLTSFNTAFKKQTQKTPSAYRKEMTQA